MLRELRFECWSIWRSFLVWPLLDHAAMLSFWFIQNQNKNKHFWLWIFKHFTSIQDWVRSTFGMLGFKFFHIPLSTWPDRNKENWSKNIKLVNRALPAVCRKKEKDQVKHHLMDDTNAGRRYMRKMWGHKSALKLALNSRFGWVFLEYGWLVDIKRFCAIYTVCFYL